MTMDKKAFRPGGGAPLALLTLAGVIVGSIFHQPSIGFLAGVGLGTLVAVLIWLGSRGRD